MADFIIAGPDGKKYKVSGENAEGALAALKKSLGQTEPAAVVPPSAPAEPPQKNPDGTYGQVPEGMVLNPVTGQMTSRELLAQNMQPNMAESAIAGGAQGSTFGLSDEGIGALNAVLPGKGTMADRYDFGREYARAMLDSARKDHAVAAYGGELAGGVTTGLATGGGGFIGGAKTLPGLIGRSALVGGTEGAIYGGGAAEGGAGNRLKGAGIGGIAGAVGGGAAPIVGKGLQYVGGLVANPVKAALNISSEAGASRAVAKALRRAGMSASEAQAAIDAAAREGQGMFTIADALGPSGRSMLSGATRTPGAAKQEIVDFLTRRQAGQGDRIGAALGDALGVDDTAAQRLAALAAGRKAAAGVNYAAARDGAGAVNLNGALDSIDALLKRDPILGDTALSVGPMGQRLNALRSRMSSGNEQLIDFDSVLAIKSDLYNQMKRNPQVAREMQPVYDALDAALENSSAAYRKANDEYRAASGVMDQIDAGKTAASPMKRSADVLAQYGSLTPEQQAAFRSGYADPLMARLESTHVSPTTNKARPLINDKMDAELGAMAKDPALLARQLGREQTMFQTASKALGGSATSDNLGDIADLQGIDLPALVNLVIHPKTGAMQLAGKAAAAIDGRGEATRQLLARALMSNNIGKALEPAAKAAGTSFARNKAVAQIAALLSGTNSHYLIPN